MRDRTFNNVLDVVGVIATAALLYHGCRWLAAIEHPLITAVACLAAASWLAFGELVRQHFMLHVIERRCLEHHGHRQPAFAIPIAAMWPLVALMHAWCRKPAPAHNGG